MIRLSSKQIHGKGAYGTYFKISPKLGIKILNHGFCKEKNIDKLLRKNEFLIKEATIGVLANQLTKGISLCFYKNNYFIGIIQKHIENYKEVDRLTHSEIRKAKKNLNKNNIIHGDLHPGNILITNKSMHIIDFDPAYCCFVGDKRTYYITKNKLIKDILKERK